MQLQHTSSWPATTYPAGKSSPHEEGLQEQGDDDTEDRQGACDQGVHCPPVSDEAGDRLIWEIERKLAEDGARPILFYDRRASCWQPSVNGLTIMVNSIFNGWRMEDVWLDK